ncbi:hypothetical protein AAHC03_013646 [Spirometra sp. Aus1]
MDSLDGTSASWQAGPGDDGIRGPEITPHQFYRLGTIASHDKSIGDHIGFRRAELVSETVCEKDEGVLLVMVSETGKRNDWDILKKTALIEQKLLEPGKPG